ASARGISVEQLMENAGWAVARGARGLLGGTYGKRVVVVCGKGNNAGDGLVAGRVLHAQGAHVTAVLTSDKHSELASLNVKRFPGRIVGMGELAREIARADLVIDGLLGVGLSRAPEGAVGEAIQACGAATAPILAVDVPSGIDADTGQVPGEAIRARATVTFTGYKPGLLFAPGAELAGRVEIADIGIADPTSEIRMLEARDVAAFIPRRARGSHKRKAGTVLVVAGSRAMPGAAALVTAASVQAGAGLTTLCAPEDVCRIVLSRVPEITTIPLSENSEGILDSKALDLISPRLNEFTTVVIGPGLGTHPATVEAVRAIVESREGALVIDADGLNALAGATDILRQRNERGHISILTPHAGELSRLVGKPAPDLDADRLSAARDAAADLAAIVVFKGPGTVIAGSETFINPTGGPALAQGGTGDVLAGMVAGLLAQKGNDIGARDVAASVWLHGAAGDRVAARVAPHPANATALIGELAATIHEVTI
ncbi:MAG TPA: NAD(P)H-hydrate dehydratase, partial [Actinomycetota bacterium]|nr:NAD(P)H-hydrate dehydratase [Actinomycetota bacterium]